MPWKPHFFSSLSAWRAWLEKHHADSQELWVGLYKLDSGRPSITWPEAVDGALCFGWFDGVRKRVDDISYKIRFTPRKARSVWSAVNVRRATELSAAGLMHPAGLAAFQKRQGNLSAIYSYAQPPGYQRTCNFWIISAKREETRLKRLAVLIEDSEHQRKIGPLTRPTRRQNDRS